MPSVFECDSVSGYQLRVDRECVHVAFPVPRPVLSSAVLNGGMIYADHVLNLHVEDKTEPIHHLEEPELTLNRFCRVRGWSGLVVGMMTAALMDTFRRVRVEEQGVFMDALVTMGLSNPRRAGDPADWSSLVTGHPSAGTINILVITNADLEPSAMAEALMIATEAKAAALQDMNILSPISGKIATGTGTDAMAIAVGFGPGKIRYCGKHVLFGEMLARAVISSLRR